MGGGRYRGRGRKQTQGGIKGFPRGNEKGIVVVGSMGINVQKIVKY